MAEDFFSDNLDAISKFEQRLETYSSASDKDSERVSLLKLGLKAIQFDRQRYDSEADFTTTEIGEIFLTRLSKPLDEHENFRILINVASFIREATFTSKTRGASEQQVLDYFVGRPDWASNDVFDSYPADYIRHTLPAELFSHQQKRASIYRDDIIALKRDAILSIESALADSTETATSLTDSLVTNFKSLASEHANAAKAVHETVFADIAKLEDRLTGYKTAIEKVASEYNFVALSHAFTRLIQNKASEKWWSAAVVLVLGAIAVVIPVGSLALSDSSSIATALKAGWSPLSVGKLAAAVGVEVILLYFFRVALRSYLLTRTQITNLQLRLSMCAFIEGYRDFAKDSGSPDSVVLERFEALIFGQLPSHDANLPATIDGLEHVSSIIQAAKKSST